MYCRKCGKEIENNSKFCPYCGNHLDMEQSHVSRPVKPKEPLKEPSKENKSVNPKKWIIPVAVVSGVAVIGVAVYMGVKVMQKPAETAEQVTADIQKQDSSDKQEKVEEVESVEPEQPEYPVEITLDEEVKSKLIDFIHLLGHVDCKMTGGGGRNFGESNIVHTYGTPAFGYDYIYMSIYKGVPFNNGQEVPISQTGSYTWQVSEETVNNYMLNTVNTTECHRQFDSGYIPFKVENGMMYFAGYDPNSMWYIETPTIDKINAVSDNTIEVQGSVLYTHIDGDEVCSYDILLKENPNSMWGGYTLTEIKSWGRQDAQNATGTTGDYILPDITNRYYSENELSGMDANTLSLARNELYARHGYIFKKPELQEYFGGKSWYMPQVSEVPDSAFNEYEKANLELIQKLEANF